MAKRTGNSPGLRLGYGATSNHDFLSSLIQMQNPWSLSSIGALAGRLMLTDESYISRTRSLILSERARMLETLAGNSHLKTYPAYANFILVRLLTPGLTSQEAFDHLIRQGLMIRDCSTFEQLKGEYIRFCIIGFCSFELEVKFTTFFWICQAPLQSFWQQTASKFRIYKITNIP